MTDRDTEDLLRRTYRDHEHLAESDTLDLLQRARVEGPAADVTEPSTRHRRRVGPMILGMAAALLLLGSVAVAGLVTGVIRPSWLTHPAGSSTSAVGTLSHEQVHAILERADAAAREAGTIKATSTQSDPSSTPSMEPFIWEGTLDLRDEASVRMRAGTKTSGHEDQVIIIGSDLWELSTEHVPDEEQPHARWLHRPAQGDHRKLTFTDLWTRGDHRTRAAWSLGEDTVDGKVAERIALVTDPTVGEGVSPQLDVPYSSGTPRSRMDLWIERGTHRVVQMRMIGEDGVMDVALSYGQDVTITPPPADQVVEDPDHAGEPTQPVD